MIHHNFPRSLRVAAAFSVVLTVLMVLAGCGPKPVNPPSGIAEQQKGVMGGTPPPGEMEKIKAMQAEQAKAQAAAQATAQSDAAAKGGK